MFQVQVYKDKVQFMSFTVQTQEALKKHVTWWEKQGATVKVEKLSKGENHEDSIGSCPIP